MLLCCDIGNTNIVLALYFNGKNLKILRLKTDLEEIKIIEILKKEFSDVNIEGVIIASVVTKKDIYLANLLNRYLNIDSIVLKNLDIPIKNRTLNPENTGIDRLINCYISHKLYGASIVVDAGTATTIDVINSDGEFLGGIITPGIKLMSISLNNFTSKLPLVELKKIDNVIGKNSTEAIQSALTFGYAGMIERVIEKIKDEYKKDSFKTIFTGGLSPFLTEITNIIHYNDIELTLLGLESLYHYIRKRGV